MTDLRKSIGLAPLVALGAAGVVGTSWIYTNGKFFTLYGAGGEIFGLAVAAVFASFVAISYGELASTIPRAGGEVVYAYAAYNRPMAFTAGWLLIGAYVSSLAFYVTAFGYLLKDVFPGLESVPLWTINGTTVHLPVLAIGVLLALAVFGLNWYGVSLGATVQLVLFGVMIVLGLALVVVGFAHGSPSNFWPPYAPHSNAVGQTIRFILPGMTFLTGFGLVAILAEDAKMPPRRIGRAVVLSVVLAAAFYCLVLLSSAWVIPWEKTALMDKGTIDAFRSAGFGVLGWAAYAIAVLGLLTSFVGLFVATSRILIAMGRAGLLPAALGRVHGSRATPGPALVFTLVITLALGWLGTGAITWFLDTGGVYIGLAWTIGVLCVYRLPRRFPWLEQPYRVRARFLPGIGAVVAVLVIAFSLWPGTDLSIAWPQEYLILGIWLVVGLVLYLGTRRQDDREARRTLLGPYYEVTFGERRLRRRKQRERARR
ncbi:MAG TPA: APC family permease [Segeticoccus sp.]|nr:APC family permease [Segeticoccus sp.]HET8600535.1 APC family permease [Segeticoccus sp.]